MYPFTGNPLSYCVPIDTYIQYSPVADRHVYKRDVKREGERNRKKIIKKTQTPKVQ